MADSLTGRFFYQFTARSPCRPYIASTATKVGDRLLILWQTSGVINDADVFFPFLLLVPWLNPADHFLLRFQSETRLAFPARFSLSRAILFGIPPSYREFENLRIPFLV